MDVAQTMSQISLLRTTLQCVYRKGTENHHPPSHWDAEVMRLIHITLFSLERNDCVSMDHTPNALLCVRWLLYGSCRPCVVCDAVRCTECSHCQSMDKHIRLAHLLLFRCCRTVCLTKVVAQLSGQLLGSPTPAPPRWSLALRTMLFVRWATPTQTVDLLFSMCNRRIDDGGALLLAMAHMLCQHGLWEGNCPVAQLCHDIFGDTFVNTQGMIDRAAGDRLYAQLFAMPWVSRWSQMDLMWRCLPKLMRQVGLCLACRIPLFSMECILSERGSCLAPVAANTLFDMLDSGIPPYPMWRIRTMLTRMNEDSGVQVYWAFCLYLHGEMRGTGFIPPSPNEDPLIGVVAALLLPEVLPIQPAVARFVGASFEDRWRQCPWTPSHRGFHSPRSCVSGSLRLHDAPTLGPSFVVQQVRGRTPQCCRCVHVHHICKPCDPHHPVWHHPCVQHFRYQ